MKGIFYYFLGFIGVLGNAQITGQVIDSATGNPISFVNIYIKNTSIGSTTDLKGYFKIQNSNPKDTLVISCLGYKNKIVIADSHNLIKLKEDEIELEEEIILPFRDDKKASIIGYKKYRKNRPFFNNAFYSLANYYGPYEQYASTPFLEGFSMITNNLNKTPALLKINIVKANQEGYPGKERLSDEIFLEVENGVNEINIDLKGKNVLMPKNGLFIVVDRLNIEQNEFSNKNSEKFGIKFYQPSIGISILNQKDNTWFGFGGSWYNPSEKLKYFRPEDPQNMALNIHFTN